MGTGSEEVLGTGSEEVLGTGSEEVWALVERRCGHW